MNDLFPVNVKWRSAYSSSFQLRSAHSRLDSFDNYADYLGHYEKVIAENREAIRLAPNDGDSYVNPMTDYAALKTTPCFAPSPVIKLHLEVWGPEHIPPNRAAKGVGLIWRSF